MRFFKPNERFWTWVGQFEGKRIVDCGCGDGALVKEMLAKSLMAVGVDPFFFRHQDEASVDWELASSIIPLTASQVWEVWQSDVIILCCRPCHNGFPGEVLALKGEAADMYYIGFEKNLDNDLGYDFECAMVLNHVGEDDETIYRITKP